MSKTDLDAIAALTTAAFGRGVLVATDAAALRTLAGLGTLALQAATNVAITGGSVTGITDLAVADGGTGASTASTARTNLGLGTIATQDATNVAVTGGSVTGITDLAVADGGTGASSASAARTNLGLVINTDVAPARTSTHFPSRLFTTGLGTATFSGGTSSPPRFLLDAASSESIVGVFEVPQGWTTMDVELWWCNDGAGTGGVTWRFDYFTYTDGGNWGAADTSAANVTDTAGAANIGVTTTIATAVPVTAGAAMKVEVVRIATDGGDTLANDAAVLSVRFAKAS